MMTQLSLIIPSYNECDNLGLLESKLSAGFHDKANIEIIIVDNGSTDATPKTLETLLKHTTLKTLRSIRVEQNQGYGYGILAGCRAAKGDVIAWTHADLQTDPSDILNALKLYNHQKSNHVFVKGKRKKRPFLDTWFTIGMQWYASWLLKQSLSDINAQPKLFSRDFYDRFLTQNAPHDFSLDLYTYYCAKRYGYKILEVPVEFTDRLHGEAKGGGSFKTKFKLIKRTFAYIHSLAGQLKQTEK